MKFIEIMRESYSEANNISKKEKSKWTAIILCLFLGILGAHKFYEGKATMGVLYAFTVGLFGFGVIRDLINYPLFTPYVYTP